MPHCAVDARLTPTHRPVSFPTAARAQPPEIATPRRFGTRFALAGRHALTTLRLDPRVSASAAACCTARAAASASPTLQFDNCSSDCGLDQNGVAAGGAHTTILVNGGVHFTTAQSSNPAGRHLHRRRRGQGRRRVGRARHHRAPAPRRPRPHRQSGTVTVVPTATLRPNRGWNGAAPHRPRGRDADLPRHHARRQRQDHQGRRLGRLRALGGPLKPTVGARRRRRHRLHRHGRQRHHRRQLPQRDAVADDRVVPASAITALNMTEQLQPNDQAVVTVVPQSAGGPVYTGGCALAGVGRVDHARRRRDAAPRPRRRRGRGLQRQSPGQLHHQLHRSPGQTASVAVSR